MFWSTAHMYVKYLLLLYLWSTNVHDLVMKPEVMEYMKIYRLHVKLMFLYYVRLYTELSTDSEYDLWQKNTYFVVLSGCLDWHTMIINLLFTAPSFHEVSHVFHHRLNMRIWKPHYIKQNHLYNIRGHLSAKLSKQSGWTRFFFYFLLTSLECEAMLLF